MWLHIKPKLALLEYRRWNKQNFSTFTIFLVIVATIFAEVNTANISNGDNDKTIAIASAHLSNTIANKTSADNSLAEKLNQLNLKYNNTLMNSTLLPFVNSCSNIDKTISNLCIIYLDMIYNLNEKCPNELTTQESFNMFWSDLNNKTINDAFCTEFPDQLETEATEQQPFAQSKKVETIKWMKRSYTCVKTCVDDMFQIQPICKLISAGYRLITNQSKKHQAAALPTASEISVQSPTTSKIGANNVSLPLDNNKQSSVSSTMSKTIKLQNDAAPNQNLPAPKPAFDNAVSKASNETQHVAAPSKVNVEEVKKTANDGPSNIAVQISDTNGNGESVAPANNNQPDPADDSSYQNNDSKTDNENYNIDGEANDNEGNFISNLTQLKKSY